MTLLATSILLFALSIAMRAFFAVSRGALINMRKPRLEELEARGVASARAIQQLADNSSRLLATAELGATFGSMFAATVAVVDFVPLLREAIGGWTAVDPLHPAITVAAYGIILLISGMLLFTVGKLVPETLAARYAEPIALSIVWPMRFASWALAPLVRLAVGLSNVLSMPLGGQHRQNASIATEEEIKTLVDAGQEEGVIEEEEKEMILSVLDFGDTVAREVMVPRIDIVATDVTTPLREALDLMVTTGHSRIPLFQDTIDDVVGLLYGKDLLKVLRDGDNPPLSQVARQPHFVPESKRVNELLQEMQARRVHVAVVIDEYGGTAGLVTIEDILEEIVGEIQDEFDAEEPEFVALPDGEGYLVDGGFSIDDFNELLQTELPSEESDTIAGFIYDQLGVIPDEGATVRYDGVLLEVRTVSDRRIVKVKAKHVGEEAPAHEPENEKETRAERRAGD